ncbi:MAG: GspH/FimT family pseudopilin [Pseudomonadota bacterium]
MVKKTASQRKRKYLKLQACNFKYNGFSVIDLLFTLILSSILLSLAFPVYQHLMIEIRLMSLTERITSAIHYARSEAIKRRSVVIICNSQDGKTCTGQWREGWIIFFDRYTTNPLENRLLRVYPSLNQNEFLEWHAAGGRSYLQLYPDGSAHGHNGSFVVCVKVLSKKSAWRISLSQTGRIRIDKKMETHFI